MPSGQNRSEPAKRASSAEIPSFFRTRNKLGKRRSIMEDDRFVLLPRTQKGKLIFSLNGTKPIDFQFISLRLHKVLEANGIDWRKEGLFFHSFRHFFNTRLVANGVNGELVRATVGHESSDMTKHYLHLVPSDLNTIMDVARQIVNL